MPKGHYLVEAVKDAIWELRAEGVSEAEIARRLVMPKRTVSKYLQRMGGIRSRPRRRAECCLTLVEREEISRGIARGDSARAIGRTLGRSHTTVSREINRCGRRGRYRAHAAEQTAWGRGRRPRPSKLELCSELRELVIERLEQDHSPQQISGWLRLSYPDNDQMQVSHETIYRALYVQARGCCDANLPGICERGVRSATHGRTPIAGRAPAASRDGDDLRAPPEVCDRAVPGHWEGDLLMGTRDTAIATLVERQTRYCQLVALPRGPTPSRSAKRSRRASSRCPSSYAARSPGIRGRRWQRTDGSASRPASRCTSAIPAVRGSAGPTRTPTASCASLPERQEPRRRESGRARRGRPQTQRPTPPNARVPDTRRETHRTDRRAPPHGPVRALISLRPTAFARQRPDGMTRCATSGVVHRRLRQHRSGTRRPDAPFRRPGGRRPSRARRDSPRSHRLPTRPRAHCNVPGSRTCPVP